mgnify:CR=1 FL=1
MLMQTVGLIFLSCVLLGISMSFLFTNAVRKPIDRLVNHVGRIAKGDFGQEESLESEDEIGLIGKAVNSMSSQIEQLMDKRLEDEKEKSSLEIRMLQAQINPHFLYNTLDMINWLSQTGRNQEVTQAIQALSRFYKLTLSRNGLMNSIETELQHVSLYIRLQNMRYDNCVTFVMDVPDELYDYTIPKLTFQPIVENAFLHGIMTTEQKKGSILLTGWKSRG